MIQALAAGGGSPLFMAAAVHQMRFAHTRAQYLEEAGKHWDEAEMLVKANPGGWADRWAPEIPRANRGDDPLLTRPES